LAIGLKEEREVVGTNGGARGMPLYAKAYPRFREKINK
jgi:hypothetical protein